MQKKFLNGKTSLLLRCAAVQPHQMDLRLQLEHAERERETGNENGNGNLAPREFLYARASRSDAE